MAPTRSRPAPTIRSRLNLLVTACVVPASLLVAALIFHKYQHDRAEIIRESQATARALMAAVDRDLAGTQSALFVLAASRYLTADDLAGFRDHARDLLGNLSINNIVLIDPSYQQRVNTLRPSSDPLPVESNPTLRRVFDTRVPVTTDVFTGAVAQKPLIAVAVPVIRDDAVKYVLAAGIWPDHLSSVLVRQRLPPDWIGSILDSTGSIVARTHDAQRFVGRKVPAALLERMSQVRDDAVEATTLDGIRVVYVFSKSEVSNWTVSLGIPVATLTDELRTSVAWLIVGTALLFSGVLLLARRIGLRIARSIRSLVEPALALGRGEAVAAPAPGIREADEVAAALADASRMLQDARYRANHDGLTGLANRVLFEEILGQQLALARRTKASLSVLAIDLDGFKPVNDLHGHAAGDEVLRAVAARLKTGIRESDLAARLGGDEFAAILVNTGQEAATPVCAKLLESLSSPYDVGPKTVHISASIGIAAYPDAGSTIDELLQRADAAMYRAKSEGKRRYVVATG